MIKIRPHLALLGILLLAVLVRFVGLNQAPPSLYWEEVALGYDAYSILHTGKDFHGNPYPIVAFPSFGDFKPSLYVYLIVPFISLFGLNEWSVRFPSALAGVVSVYFVYLLGARWNKKVGVWSAFLFAIQPWSIQISRTGFETNVATALMTAGMWFGFQANHKRRYVFLSVICLCFAMYTYHAARIVAPLLGLSLAFYWLRSWSEPFLWKMLKVCVIGIFAALLVSPIARSLNSPEVRKRADETSIFAGTVLAERSNAQIAAAGGGKFAKILHHRYLVGAQMIMDQYVRNFDPAFLFLKGDGNPRHSSAIVGGLYLWEIGTVFLGLLVIWRSKKLELLLLVWWIVIAGVPASVTTVSPHALRFMAAAPVFSLISGLGIVSLLGYFRDRNRIKISLLVLGVGSLVYFLQYFFNDHRIRFSESYQYGYKELFKGLQEEQKLNEKVMVTRQEGRPSMYYLFFTKKNPQDVQDADSSVRKDQQELLQVGSYDFVDTIDTSKYSLFATSPKNVPSTAQKIKEIRRLDNSVVWVIWRI